MEMTVFDMDSRRNKEKKEENRLLNWVKWEEEWKKTQAMVTDRMGVQPGNLLMNFSEGLSLINEERQLLEYAKIPTKFDKYRGKPNFYKLPDALAPKQCPCVVAVCKCRCGFEHKKVHHRCSDNGEYFAVETKQQRFIVPSVEIIGSPLYIQQEKNILSGTRNIYEKWKSSSYRKEQLEKWSKEIANIIPHFPNIDELMIVGTTLVPTDIDERDNSISKTTDGSVTPELEQMQKVTEEPSTPTIPKLSLKFNDITFDDNEAAIGTTSLRVFFQHNISSNTISRDSLTFENNGASTLRISWRKIEKFRIFRTYTLHQPDKYGFYFNKKELVILPGRRVDVPIWFKTETPGHFSECWELTTNPKMWGEEFHVKLVLESFAYFKDYKRKVDALMRYIDIESKNILIKDILNELVEQTKYVETSVRFCVYGEPELFEVANLVNEHPLFTFNQELVDALVKLYDKVKVDETKWDFCVNYLKKLTHKKDTSLYGENKLLKLKQKLLQMQSGKIEGIHLNDKAKKEKKIKPETKKSKTSVELGAPALAAVEFIEKEPYEYSNQLELSNILRKFDSPVIPNTDREKYFACFEMFCVHINIMCQQLELLEHENSIVTDVQFPPFKYELIPVSEQPSRLVYEYFEHFYIPTDPYDVCYPFEAKRKPKILQDIAEGDVEDLYRIYFNKSLPLGKKDKKQKADKSPVSKDKKAKLPKGAKKEVSLQSFDPYVETFVYEPHLEVSAASKKGSPVAARKLPDDYKYKQYLVAYSSLCNAVDAVVDTLQSFDCIVPYNVVNVVKSQFSDNDKKN